MEHVSSRLTCGNHPPGPEILPFDAAGDDDDDRDDGEDTVEVDVPWDPEEFDDPPPAPASAAVRGYDVWAVVAYREPDGSENFDAPRLLGGGYFRRYAEAQTLALRAAWDPRGEIRGAATDVLVCDETGRLMDRFSVRAA